MQDMSQTGIENFLKKHLELTQMTMGQGHKTPSSHKQSLCELKTSNVST